MKTNFTAVRENVRKTLAKLRDLRVELEAKRREIRECEEFLSRQERALETLYKSSSKSV